MNRGNWNERVMARPPYDHVRLVTIYYGPKARCYKATGDTPASGQRCLHSKLQSSGLAAKRAERPKKRADDEKRLLAGSFEHAIWPGVARAQYGIGRTDAGCHFIGIIEEDVLVHARHFDACLRLHMAVGKQDLTNAMVRAHSPRTVTAKVSNQRDNRLIASADIRKFALRPKWQAIRVTRRRRGRKVVIILRRHLLQLC